MKKIYENIDFTRVGYLQSILESEGISTHLKNAGTSALSGLVAAGHCYPELWVLDDAQYDKAIGILKPHMDFRVSGDDLDEA